MVESTANIVDAGQRESLMDARAAQRIFAEGECLGGYC